MLNIHGLVGPKRHRVLNIYTCEDEDDRSVCDARRESGRRRPWAMTGGCGRRGAGGVCEVVMESVKTRRENSHGGDNGMRTEEGKGLE